MIPVIKCSMEERLKEIEEENITWLIYLGIIALSYYANYKEVKYILAKDEKVKKEYRLLMIIIFVILVIVYYHFTMNAYKSIKNLNSSDSKKKRNLLYASFIASLFVLISGVIFLIIIIVDEDIEVEIAFN